MTAREFYNKEEKYTVFSKLTRTGISDDLNKITEFAEDYHQAKLKLSGIANVGNRRELLLDFADYSERDKTSQTTDECVDNYLDSIK